MTTDSIYKKIMMSSLLEAAGLSTVKKPPKSTLRDTRRNAAKAAQQGLVPVGVALFAPASHAVHDADNHMWKLRDGFHATHKIEDGELVVIPPEERDDNSDINSARTKVQKINKEITPEEKEDDFTPTPLQELDINPMDFLERVKQLKQSMTSGDDGKAKEIAISLIKDYELYIQGDDVSELRTARNALAKFPGGRYIAKKGSGPKDPYKDAVKVMSSAMERLNLIPKKESAMSPLVPSDALKRSKTDSPYGMGQKKVKIKKNQDGTTDELTIEWADQSYSLKVNNDVDDTENAVMRLEQSLNETDEAYSKRKSKFRRYSDTWRAAFEAVKKKYGKEISEGAISQYADILYSRQITRNRIIRSLGSMVATNGHMNASVYYGEGQDVIEIGSLLKSKISKLHLQNEDRLLVEKFIDDVTTGMVSSDKNKLNVDRKLEELWVSLSAENIQGLSKHYPALVECLTGIREQLHDKIVIFPDDSTHALGDCYAIPKHDRVHGTNNGIAVSSEIEMWNVKLGAGAASSLEKRIQMSVYRGLSYQNQDGDIVEVSTFEVQDDLNNIVSSDTFNDIFNDCDNEKSDMVTSRVDKYYDKYKDVILKEYGYMPDAMLPSAKKTTLAKIRMCLRQGVRPDLNQTCQSTPSKGDREVSAWSTYREMMYLTEAINNNLVIAQQFKSLIWKEDKIIECDATREDEGPDSSPYIAGVLANLSPGKVESKCNDGVMIPQTKFQARTVPIQKI